MQLLSTWSLKGSPTAGWITFQLTVFSCTGFGNSASVVSSDQHLRVNPETGSVDSSHPTHTIFEAHLDALVNSVKKGQIADVIFGGDMFDRSTWERLTPAQRREVLSAHFGRIEGAIHGANPDAKIFVIAGDHESPKVLQKGTKPADKKYEKHENGENQLDITEMQGHFDFLQRTFGDRITFGSANPAVSTPIPLSDGRLLEFVHYPHGATDAEIQQALGAAMKKDFISALFIPRRLPSSASRSGKVVIYGSADAHHFASTKDRFIAGSAGGNDDAIYPEGLLTVLPPRGRAYLVTPDGLRVTRTFGDTRRWVEGATSTLPADKATWGRFDADRAVEAAKRLGATE